MDLSRRRVSIRRLVRGSVLKADFFARVAIRDLPQSVVLVLLCATLTLSSVVFAQQGTFVPAGSMNNPREYHTATLLNNGKVLVAGGVSNGVTLASAELYDPATGTFTSTGSMNNPREFHTATLLNSGMVLIAGGDTTSGATAELYDPSTGTFAPTGSLNTGRAEHTATLLNNGKVLIAGGAGGVPASVPLAGAELYDPATGTFVVTGSLNTGRYAHTATLLNNGTVLIASGVITGLTLASAELYDPATAMFTATGNLNTGRFGHTATLLDNGKVLVAGGVGNSLILASAELYDPTAGTFAVTGSLNTGRAEHMATLLNDGVVLVAGGQSSSSSGAAIYPASAELYDPATGKFTLTGSLNTGRDAHTATLLNNGTVLIASGYGSSGYLASTELYEQVVVSPTNLAFSGQPVGTTSPSQTTTLTNDQSTALTVTGILINGSNAFFARLISLLREPWQPVVTVGHQRCAFCRFSGGPSKINFEGSSIVVGTANLFIPAGGCVYVAPSLIAHYVDAHEYGPPADFQEAVLKCPEMKSFAYLKEMRARGLAVG